MMQVSGTGADCRLQTLLLTGKAGQADAPPLPVVLATLSLLHTPGSLLAVMPRSQWISVQSAKF